MISIQRITRIVSLVMTTSPEGHCGSRTTYCDSPRDFQLRTESFDFAVGRGGNATIEEDVNFTASVVIRYTSEIRFECASFWGTQRRTIKTIALGTSYPKLVSVRTRSASLLRCQRYSATRARSRNRIKIREKKRVIKFLSSENVLKKGNV